MIPVKASSFGRLTAALRRKPGGIENANILPTLSREMLKCRAASRWLRPSAQAGRTFRYMSTVMILPPSLKPAGKDMGGRLLRRPQRARPAATLADFLTAVLTPKQSIAC